MSDEETLFWETLATIKDFAEEMRDYKTFIKMRKKLIEVIGLEESV